MGSRTLGWIPFSFVYFFSITDDLQLGKTCVSIWGSGALYHLFLLFISACALCLCLTVSFGVLLLVSVNFVIQNK